MQQVNKSGGVITAEIIAITIIAWRLYCFINPDVKIPSLAKKNDNTGIRNTSPISTSELQMWK